MRLPAGPASTVWDCCLSLRSTAPSPRVHHIVGNHYYYRSRDDVFLKSAQWRAGTGLPDHVRNVNLTDALLWGRKEDFRLKERWGAELRRRVGELVTTSRTGKCRHPAALKRSVARTPLPPFPPGKGTSGGTWFHEWLKAVAQS